MACKVHYLSSAGIQRREVKGVEKLAAALPINWLLYASLNAFPPRSAPIEIDLLCVMDDRVVLLELKDWNGTLTSNGDNWLVNGAKRGRSAVVLGNEKAKKIKGLLVNQIPQLSGVYVDSRVVLTASATRDALPQDEKPFVLTLEEACKLGDRDARNNLLGQVRMPKVRPNLLTKDFDKIVKGGSYFQPLKMNWDGYSITDEDFFVHRGDIWREHRAHLSKEERLKALLRLWRFDKLPAGLNEPDNRELIARREFSVLGHLGEQRSWMGDRGILKPIGSPPQEILTQHHQLLDVPTGWTTLRRYLERNGGDLTGDELIDIVHSLVSMVAELHRHGVAHRDIGGDSIWVGDPTSLKLTGFHSARLPDDQSVSDWLAVLQTYADPETPGTYGAASAKERDVHSIGRLMRHIAELESASGELPAGWADVTELALAPPGKRYVDACALAEAIGELRTPSGPTVDQSRLDAFQSRLIPYASYPPTGQINTGDRSTRYEALVDGHRSIVKVWNGLKRGEPQIDYALLSMLEAAASLQTTPLQTAAEIVAFGLSPVGPYLVTRFVEGTALSTHECRADEARVELIERIIGAVKELHSRGLGHGDLHPDNVIVHADGVTLIDLLDIAPLGTGRVRSLAFAPESHERRSDQEIDRFAVCKMALGLADDEWQPLIPIFEAAKAELARNVIESLDPISIAVQQARRLFDQSATAHFEISAPSLPALELASDGGQFWVKSFRTLAGVESFFIRGPVNQLLLRLRNEKLEAAEVSETLFRDLAQGTPVTLALGTRDGEEGGLLELVNFLRSSVPAETPDAEASLQETDGDSEDEGIDDAEVGDDGIEPPVNTRLDISKLWLRSAEIEEDAALTVRIDRQLPDIGTATVFQYAATKPLEFDDDSVVEVRLGNVRGWRVGTLDLPHCDDRQLAIRDMRGKIAEGESITLVDRRDRVSKERRRRAVERLTSRAIPITNLIDFFDPDADIPSTAYSINPDEADLKVYGLNAGQRGAFRHLLETGPLGLLQGPPGSGKTRFIAAFAHWLLRKGGARRILIASQSHEAVNNVLEELLRTYRTQGGHSDLLRVGSRGATDRTRSYQAKSLRERYRVRFENGLKTRVAHAAGAMGAPRQFVLDVVDVDLQIGTIQRSLEMALLANANGQDRDERKRSDTRVRTLLGAFSAASSALLGREIDAVAGETAEIVEEAYSHVLQAHTKASPSDLVATRKILALSHEWRDTLASSHRNFDEFLAKTRNVVAGTCVGLGQSQIRLDQATFDWVIVDEAARCTSGELAVPIQMGSRVVLVGDQRQLRPMVDRDVQIALRDEMRDVSRGVLERSDFERAFASPFGQRTARVLDEQYRMTPAISDLVSEIFYKPHSVLLKPSSDRKADLAFESLPGLLSTPLIWIDTAKAAEASEKSRNDGRDVWNEAEIDAVLAVLAEIASKTELAEQLSARPDPQIGVICMYSEQKRRIEREWSQRPFTEAFRRTVTIDTVDAYQGKENAIVIVTLVRSNEQRRPYHVGRENRCNVALSRAKERLIIVGDTSMWGDPRTPSPMRKVLAHVRARSGEVATIVPATDLQA